MAKTKGSLVVVESPAKARTIGKYLALGQIPQVTHGGLHRVTVFETRTLWSIDELVSSANPERKRTSLKLLSQPVHPHAGLFRLGDGVEKLRIAERVP